MEMMSITINIEQDMEELIPGYLANRREDIEKIIENLSSGNFNTIASLSHRMKGSGSSYGFSLISEIGAELEQRANQGDFNRLIPLIDKLKNFLDRLEIKYV